MASEYTPEQLEVMRRFVELTTPRREPDPPTTATGIQLRVPAESYHRRQLRTVSKSALDEVRRSPAHYLAWVNGYEPEATPALKFGTALHMALLEPDRFKRTYAVAPDFGDQRYKENKERKAAWLADHPGVEMLSHDADERIIGMLGSVMRHPAASRLILDGQQEVTLRWKDPITGLACKARADYWVKSKRLCVDLKSTEDASPETFSRSVYKWGYHLQDALYRMGFAECGEPIEHFAILAVEKEPPYAVAVYTLDRDAVAKGFSAARVAMDRLAECIAANDFPSYSDGVTELSLPPWAA